MWVVYRATELSLGRQVALKVIAGELAGGSGFRRRFATESRTAASLDHPNVIPIFGGGEHEGVPFLVMRYVEGADLRDEIKSHGALAPERVAHIVAQAASALDAAHAAGLVHRDVKPANILLTPSDHVYLTDFGLTKNVQADEDETQTGHLVGTLNYVAPEQIRGERIDRRTDVYALGCVVFHALTGDAPFPMQEREAKMWAHLSEPPPAPSAKPEVPAACDAVVARAMAKQPEERFESAGALAKALDAALFEGTTVAERPSGADDPAGAEPAGPPPPVARELTPDSTPPPPSQLALGRRQRAGIVAALLDSFCLAVLFFPLLAGLVFGLFPPILVVAAGAYAAAVAVTLRGRKEGRAGVPVAGPSNPP
jgi:serine/threonine protein kinase